MSVHITSFVPVSSAPGVVYQLGIIVNDFVVVSFLMFFVVVVVFAFIVVFCWH